MIAALFWELLFSPCLHHTIKLISKLGLRMYSIAIGVVQENIKLGWANKTIRQLDQLFQNNPNLLTKMAIIYAQPSIIADGKIF